MNRYFPHLNNSCHAQIVFILNASKSSSGGSVSSAFPGVHGQVPGNKAGSVMTNCSSFSSETSLKALARPEMDCIVYYYGTEGNSFIESAEIMLQRLLV